MGEFPQLAIVLLCLGGSLPIEGMLRDETLQLLVLLFTEVSDRLPHLNYNRTNFNHPDLLLLALIICQSLPSKVRPQTSLDLVLQRE